MTIRPNLEGRATEASLVVDGTPFDELGNPLSRLDGCPNCGDGKGLLIDGITYFGMRNGGLDPNGCCSRRCELQHEHATTLEAPNVA